MNTEPNPSPLIPQGSLLDQKNRSRARVKLAVFFVLAIHGLGLMALLMQGCQKEKEPGTTMTEVDTNQPAPPAYDAAAAMAATSAPPAAATSAVPAGAVSPETMPGMTPVPAVDTAAHVAPPGPGTEYVIAKGDTFTTIAKKFGVSTRALVDANPGVTPTALKIGQKIQVPPPSATPASTTAAPAVAENGSQVYTVKSGDTLSKIATKYSVTVKAIRSANNLKTDSIKVGQKLKIPVKAGAPAPAPAIPETVPTAPAGTAP